ncbi:hypothetical protein Droror1_Dr00009715 [Drosera rotundifolia]
MFFAHMPLLNAGENTVSTLGRFVLIIWLFVLLFITQSYTASLTSLLTVQQLTTGVQGLDSLVANGEPIGVQDGSFVRHYLISEKHIALSRIISLKNQQDYI